MEFLNPTALLGLFALPMLLVPYLVRRKPRRVVFSSLLLFLEQGTDATAKPWGRLRLPPIFFLQLLLLILLILALGEPVLSVRVSNVAVVLDNSASMQAQVGGTARIALARREAARVLADFGATGKVDVFRSVPRLEKINKTALAPSEAAALVARLEPYDMADVAADDNRLLNRLAVDSKYERVYLITDRPARGQSATIRVITVGRPGDNLALTAFHVSRSSLANARLESQVEVTNYSSRERRVRVAIQGGGATLATREIVVPAGGSAAAAFQGFAEHPYYEAELDVQDALALDNRRFAVPASSRNLRVMGISPRPQALASLRAVAGITVDNIAPEDYQTTDRSAYGLEIFHLSAPADLPGNPSLLILPPEQNPAVRLGAPVMRPSISGWRQAHPLNRYLNVALLRPAYARPFVPQIAGESVLESPQGTIAFAAEHQGKRHLVLGFDPFPYLGRDNLPMSIFTLNLLDWFLAAGGAAGQATGEPIVLSDLQRSATVTMPRGDAHSLDGRGSYSNTFFQGIYQVNRNGNRRLLAINYQGAGESDLRERKLIELQGSDGGAGSVSALFSFWPYLLMLSLLFFIVEWLLMPRLAAPRISATVRPKLS